MPLISLLLPALVAAQPSPAPQPLDQVQRLMGAIPEALVNGKRSDVRGLVAKAKAGWEQAKPEARKAMPEAEITFIDRQLKAMQKMRPVEQAVGALGISSTLARFQPRSHRQDLLQVERLIESAWCAADSGHWDPFPNVAAAVGSLIDQDQGQHTLVVVRMQEALKALEASHPKHQAATTKKALKELLGLVDLLGKP